MAENQSLGKVRNWEPNKSEYSRREQIILLGQQQKFVSDFRS